MTNKEVIDATMKALDRLRTNALNRLDESSHRKPTAKEKEMYEVIEIMRIMLVLIESVIKELKR